MAAFDYQAVNSRGKMIKGVIEGDTARQVRNLLREQGLMPTEVIPSLTKKSSGQSFSQGKIKGSSAGIR